MDRETATERSRQVGFGSIAIGVALMVRPGIAKAAGSASAMRGRSRWQTWRSARA